MDAAREWGAAPMTLINGAKLVDLLTEHRIGVRKKLIDLWGFDASAIGGEDEIAERVWLTLPCHAGVDGSRRQPN